MVLVAVAAMAVGGILPSPYVIEMPGPTFNTIGKVVLQPSAQPTALITVDNARTYETTGNLNMTTVSLLGTPNSTPSWFRVTQALIDPTQNVLPKASMYPEGTSDKDATEAQNAQMSQSQQQATAAALTQLGETYERKISVAGFTPTSKADGKLQAGDVLTKANGQEVTGVNVLLQAAERTAIGGTVAVDFTRNNKAMTTDIPVVSIQGDHRLGVLLNYDYKFPVTVKFADDGVGGPSAGMMFALGIIDKLTPGAMTGGKFIAGTGTIDETGTVGAIGGIQQKMVGASRDGAKYFLAPASNCNDVVGNIPSGLKVVKVATLSQARSAVETIAKTGSTASLAKCTK